MSSVNLGRVQGAGVFYSSAASGTGVELGTVTPTSVKPLAGDTIVFSNGDLRTVTGISGTAVTCGEIVGSIKGTNGTRGSNWSTAESIPMPDGSQSAGDQFLTTGADNNGNVYEWGGQWILKGNIKGADAKFYIPLLSGGIGPAGTKPTSVSTGSFGTAANWSDGKAGEVGDIFNCIFENTVSDEIWFCTGALTNATNSASLTAAVKIGSGQPSASVVRHDIVLSLTSSPDDDKILFNILNEDKMQYSSLSHVVMALGSANFMNNFWCSASGTLSTDDGKAVVLGVQDYQDSKLVVMYTVPSADSGASGETKTMNLSEIAAVYDTATRLI